jgi:hypothetical protein
LCLRGDYTGSLRSLNKEATILGRNKSPHVVRLSRNICGVSERKEVVWLIIEQLEGWSLDVMIISDPGGGQTRHSRKRTSCGLRFKCWQHSRPCTSRMSYIVISSPLILLTTTLSISSSMDSCLQSSQAKSVHLPTYTPFAPHYTSLSVDTCRFTRKQIFNGHLLWLDSNMEEQAPRLNTVCTEHGLPSVSSGLEDIFAKGLHKKIPDRYKDATEMRDAIESFITPISQSAQPKN